jgi:hypothetical protein
MDEYEAFSDGHRSCCGTSHPAAEATELATLGFGLSDVGSSRELIRSAEKVLGRDVTPCL